MFRKFMLVSAVISALIALPVMAQDTTQEAAPAGEIFAEGLNYPRGISVDAEGNLWIAEAGIGGEVVIMQEEGMTTTGGLTGEVTMVTPDGTQSVFLGNLISSFSDAEGSGLGLYRAIPHGDSVWMITSDMGPAFPLGGTVIELDRATLRTKNFIDLTAYENANNTDGTEEVYSNPSDLNWDADGNLYIVDTGANAILNWSPEEGLTPFLVWNDNPVPTSIEFADDGSLYVGFLGTEIAPGAGHVEHWSADGTELIETFEGLNAVTDIALDADGGLYAVQLISGFGEEGPLPGNVIKLSAEGQTVVADNLQTPFSLAWAADGSLLVSTGTTFAAPGSGTVVKIAL